MRIDLWGCLKADLWMSDSRFKDVGMSKADLIRVCVCESILTGMEISEGRFMNR